MTNQLREIAALTLSIALLTAAAMPAFAEKKAKNKKDGEFARATIDLGIVVSDIEKAAEFYTKAIGFQEVEGFSVAGDFCKAAGLTDGKKLDIRVFVLADDKNATRIKLMEVPGAKSKQSDNETIHSQLGFSYLTIFVKDTGAALARLESAGVSPVAEGPVPLPKNLPQGVYLTVVRDPDGNLIELVGPKKQD